MPSGSERALHPGTRHPLPQVHDAIAAYLRAADTSKYAEVIDKANQVGGWVGGRVFQRTREREGCTSRLAWVGRCGEHGSDLHR